MSDEGNGYLIGWVLGLVLVLIVYGLYTACTE